MKKLFSVIVVALSLSHSVFATESIKLEHSDRAYLQVCSAVRMRTIHGYRIVQEPGCLNAIVINGKTLVVRSDMDDVSKVLENIIGTNQFHRISKSAPFTAEGYVVKKSVMGAVRPVFMVTALSRVILPK